MNRLMENKDLKISFIFAVIGIIASYLVTLYQLSVFSDEIINQIIAQLGSIDRLILIATAQGGLLTFIASYVGLKIAKKVNLELNFKYDKEAMILAVIVGLVTAFIIVASDKFIFAPYLTAIITEYVISPIYLISGVIYGGIIEEIFLRLLVMSLFVMIIWKLFARSTDSLNIPDWIYTTAIFLAAALFAALHLPFTAQAIGLSVPIIIRAFVLNGIGGIGFGYLFWKKGLAYSMVAHGATHIFMQLIFMPIMF